MRNVSVVILSLFFLLSLGATGAEAHKVKLFAMSEGKTISGYVYFSGGERARNVKVVATDPGGAMLAESTTDEKGEFTLPVTARCDYHLVADLGDGHAASYLIGGKDLPPDLPPCGNGGAAPSSAAVSPANNGDNGKGKRQRP